jgi:hypothetical protein
MILSRAATILYTSIALLASGVKAQTDKAKGDKSPTKGKTSKKPTKVCDDENGYEAFRNAPPADAKVKFEGVVDCETQTYTLKYSFEPDKVRNCLWLCDDSDIHDVLLLSSYVKLTFISIFHITEPSLH